MILSTHLRIPSDLFNTHTAESNMRFRLATFAVILTWFLVKEEALTLLFEMFPRWHTAIYPLESCAYWVDDSIKYIDGFFQDIILRSGCSVWTATRYTLQNHIVCRPLNAVRR
jgi:hypothetical protein